MSDKEISNRLPLLQKGKYISLKTFRKSGEGVPSPVWFVEKNLKFYVCTRENTFKVRRIKNNSQVQIASSNARGKVNSEFFDAEARLLTTEEIRPVRTLFRQKYRMFRLWSYFQNRGKKEGARQIYLEITLK